jgi:Mn2+/Fe2+ NRAMP family transporter
LRYATIARVLKWLALALFTYVATGIHIQPPWGEVLRATFVPTMPSTKQAWATVVAILGTTISPYLFFWQASQEVEEQRATDGDEPLRDSAKGARDQLRRIKIDTWLGMTFSNLIAFSIMLTTAVTLHNAGITDIESSAQAAQALKPVAGEFAFVLFAAGIIGTGLLAIPVLAGSAAYAFAEAMKWPIGHSLEPMQAKGFYGIITLATAIGIGIDFAPIDPIKALVWSAMLNGVVAVPIMAVMMRMAVRPDIMGAFTITPKLQRLGWFATAVMGIAVVAMLGSLLV